MLKKIMIYINHKIKVTVNGSAAYIPESDR